MTYTIHASHHPGANERPATADAIASWITIFDGPLYSDGAARGYAEEIGRQHRSVRVFKHARSPVEAISGISRSTGTPSRSNPFTHGSQRRK